MTDLIFNDPEEARAWDAIVTELVGCYENPDDVVSIADAMILERRKRMAPAAQIVPVDYFPVNVDSDWIPFNHGDPMPCDRYRVVEYRYRNGRIFAPTTALHVPWQSECADDFKVDAWRPA